VPGRRDKNGVKLKLIFFAVGTGGAGKTFLCRLIGDFLKRAGIKAKLFDTDEVLKRDLVRFFPGICTVVDIATREKLSDFIRSLASTEADIIVIDIKADRESDLKALNYITPGSVQAFGKRGMHFCLLLPVVQAKIASLTSLPGWYDLFGPAASYVVVSNEKDGPVSDAGVEEIFGSSGKFLR
jgi:hypothetical protein